MSSYFASVDEYINSFPKDTQSVLQRLREIIKEELADPQEVISYNIPAFRVHGKNILYFSGWKKHTSIYPFSSNMQRDIAQASLYKMSGKGTIQFPLDKDLPVELIQEIVRYRLKEVAKE